MNPNRLPANQLGLVGVLARIIHHFPVLGPAELARALGLRLLELMKGNVGDDGAGPARRPNRPRLS